MKKIISLLLAAILLTGALVLTGCTGNGTGDPKDTAPEAPSDGLQLVKDGTPLYTVIRPETAPKATVDGAVSIKAAIAAATGKDVEIASDWEKDTAEKKPEILVGDTNREESAAAKEGLGENEYRICVVGNKLCVVADGDKAMKLAVEALLKELLPTEGAITELNVPKTIRLTGAYVWPGPTLNVYTKDSKLNISPLEAVFDDPDSVRLEDVKTSIGKDLGMHFADFLVIEDEIWAYYIEWIDGEAGVGLATSTDGVKFTKKATVLRPSEDGEDWDDKMASFPGIWYEDGTYYLVYEGSGADNRGAVGLATSKDGVNFEKHGIIVDYHHDGKGLYGANVGTPDIIRVDGTWYVTFHAFDWTDCMICYAYGDDLMNLEIAEENPIIPTDAKKDEIASGTTGRRDLLWYDGWFYMVYEISTDQPYDNAHWCHMFARSEDMIHWEKGGPLVEQTESGYGNDGPAFLVMNDEIYVYYRVGGSMSRYRLAC